MAAEDVCGERMDSLLSIAFTVGGRSVWPCEYGSLDFSTAKSSVPEISRADPQFGGHIDIEKAWDALQL